MLTFMAMTVDLDIQGIDPSVSLTYSYGGQLYGRVNGSVTGWNITFDAENTFLSVSALPSQFDNADEQSIINTSLASWSVPPDMSADGESEVLVFYQTQSEGITVFSGDLESDNWVSSSLPVPDG